MIGDETFISVFKQILSICMVKDLSFTKEDIEQMPPFERTGYIELIKDILEERNSNSNG